MHAWAPEYIEELYPAQRERHLPAFFDRNLRGMPSSAPEATAGMGCFAEHCDGTMRIEFDPRRTASYVLGSVT